MKFLTFRGTLFRAREACSSISQNLWMGNMTLTWFFTSNLMLNFRIEKNHNKTQRLIRFVVCQLLRARQTKYLENCVITTILVIFEDLNNQHKHIFQ